MGTHKKKKIMSHHPCVEGSSATTGTPPCMPVIINSLQGSVYVIEVRQPTRLANEIYPLHNYTNGVLRILFRLYCIALSWQ